MQCSTLSLSTLRQVLRELDCGQPAVSAVLLPPPPTAQVGAGRGEDLHSGPGVGTAGVLTYQTFSPAQVVGNFGDGFHVRSI